MKNDSNESTAADCSAATDVADATEPRVPPTTNWIDFAIDNCTSEIQHLQSLLAYLRGAQEYRQKSIQNNTADPTDSERS